MSDQSCTDRDAVGSWRVAVWCGLDNKKSLEKLRGLDACAEVESAVVFRQHPIEGLSEKFRQINPPRPFRRSAILSHLFALVATIVWCLRFKPDVAISISLTPHALIAGIGRLVSGSRYVIWYIGTDMYRQLPHPIIRRILVPWLKRADCTMVMGRNSLRHLKKLGWVEERMLVGKNSYDLDEYRPEPNSFFEWDLIFTGRIDRKSKDFELLLQAALRARADYPMLRLAIVGSGPDQKWLAKRIDMLDLRSNVFPLGRRSDVASLLRASRAFIMTSAWEGLPASLVEAFACGVPAIVPDVGDINTVARNGYNSFVVSERSAESFAQAIACLLQVKQKRNELASGAKATGEKLRKDSFCNAVNCWDEVMQSLRHNKQI